MTITEQELKIVRDIIGSIIPECTVKVFGSRHHGTTKKYSDLDLAFVCSDRLGMRRTAQLVDAFSESDLPYRVDVVDYATASQEFRAIIDADCRVIYSGFPSDSASGLLGPRT